MVILKIGIPAHDTIARVVSCISPKCIGIFSFREKYWKERTGNADDILYKLSGFNSREVFQCYEKSLGCEK